MPGIKRVWTGRWHCVLRKEAGSLTPHALFLLDSISQVCSMSCHHLRRCVTFREVMGSGDQPSKKWAHQGSREVGISRRQSSRRWYYKQVSRNVGGRMNGIARWRRRVDRVWPRPAGEGREMRRRQGDVRPTFPGSLGCHREKDQLIGEVEGFCLQPSISHN